MRTFLFSKQSDWSTLNMTEGSFNHFFCFTEQASPLWTFFCGLFPRRICEMLANRTVKRSVSCQLTRERSRWRNHFYFASIYMRYWPHVAPFSIPSQWTPVIELNCTGALGGVSGLHSNMPVQIFSVRWHHIDTHAHMGWQGHKQTNKKKVQTLKEIVSAAKY